MRLGLPIGMLVMLASASAQATPSARLVYSRTADAASCPDEPALHKAVAARFGYDPFFAWAKQTVVVQVRREGIHYAARVQLVDEKGLAHGARDIGSGEDDCTELLGAVALAISIALDATASITPPPAPPVETKPPAESPPDVAPDSREVVTPTPPERASSFSPRRAHTMSLGIEGVTVAGLAPNIAPGIAAFADVRGPSLSVGIELQADLVPTWTLAPAGRVDSALFSASLAPCFRFGGAFFCGLVEMGWLEARGTGVADPLSDGALFLAAGARAGIEWPLTEDFFMRFHGDGLYNLERATFALDTQRRVAPNLGGAFGLGFGATFL